jgi:hypothetical protein
MSENQSSAKSTVEGELSLDDLEKIAGGTGGLESPGSDLFAAENQVFMPTQDNMFAAFDGAKGTTLGQLNSNVKPMNLTMTFP